MYTSPRGEKELVSWIKKNIKKSDKIIQTPYLKPYEGTAWLFFPKVRRINMPPFKKFTDLLNLINRRKITYVIITPQGFRRRHDLLKDYFKIIPQKGLCIEQTPPKLKLVYANLPIDFLVFKTINIK